MNYIPPLEILSAPAPEIMPDSSNQTTSPGRFWHRADVESFTTPATSQKWQTVQLFWRTASERGRTAPSTEVSVV
jgi:hypothetical protein